MSCKYCMTEKDYLNYTLTRKKPFENVEHYTKGYKAGWEACRNFYFSKRVLKDLVKIEEFEEY